MRSKEAGEMLFENRQIFIVDDDESVCRALVDLIKVAFSAG